MMLTLFPATKMKQSQCISIADLPYPSYNDISFFNTKSSHELRWMIIHIIYVITMYLSPHSCCSFFFWAELMFHSTITA